jgi:hypothetical protein
MGDTTTITNLWRTLQYYGMPSTQYVVSIMNSIKPITSRAENAGKTGTFFQLKQ